MGLCDCNQGRLPCTCKDDPVGAMIAEDQAKHKLLTVSELKKPNPVNHYTAMANDAAAVVRITAERDALQLLLNERDERLDELSGLLTAGIGLLEAYAPDEPWFSEARAALAVQP